MIRNLLIVLAFALLTASLASGQTIVCQDGTCQMVRTPVRNVVSAAAATTRNVVRTVAPEPILFRAPAAIAPSATDAPPVLMYDLQTRQVRPWRAAVRERVSRFFERLRRPLMFRRFRC